MASDADIHFPPGQRRDKPSFEPPPWERDQFEELARQRREAEEAQAAARKAVIEAEAAVVEETAPEQPEAPVAAIESEGADEGSVPSEAEDDEPQLDPKHVEVLMMGLRAEEPRPDEAYWKITMIAGVTSALIGMVVTTWGVVGMATPKQSGAGPILIVMMLLVFGLGFIIGGAWVVFKSLRQRGVL